VSDMSGSVVAHFGYGPYGARALHGAVDGEPGFAQGRAAGELLLLGHRLYDPEAGRFLAPDPVFQIVNGYVYTLGDPIHFWDPSGLQAVSSLGIARGVAQVGATVGVVAFASAVTLGAAPAVVTVGAIAALGFAGVYVGLIVPVSPLPAAAAAALAMGLNTPWSSPFGGFAAGQMLRAVLDDTSLPPAQPPPPRPPTPDPPTGPDIGKTVDFRIADPGQGGCSPTVLASRPPLVPRKWLAAAALVQLLAAISLVRRAATRR
jgi:RHS repeat-associated protein